MCLDNWCKVKGFEFVIGWKKRMGNALLYPTMGEKK